MVSEVVTVRGAKPEICLRELEGGGERELESGVRGMWRVGVRERWKWKVRGRSNRLKSGGKGTEL